MTAKNDSDELEALFDAVSAEVKASEKEKEVSNSGDNSDLEALFDQVSAETAKQDTSLQNKNEEDCECLTEKEKQVRVFNRIGHMARSLHTTLGELGLDKLIEQAVTVIPDAKDRLAYVAALTEQAAERVLNATDVAIPLVDELGMSSKDFSLRWDKAFSNQLTTEEFKQLAEETRAFFRKDMQLKLKSTHAQLTEIMMAQDFQDLTGQVIKKIVVLAQTLEADLMALLIDVVPDAMKTEEVNNLMNGPVVNPEGRTDVVVNQKQVDDLLDSLGF